MFLLGITRATNLDGREIPSLILLRFRLIFSSTNSDSPDYLRGCSSILCVNSPRPLGVYRPWTNMWGEVLLVSFLIPLQWKDTSVDKKRHDPFDSFQSVCNIESLV